uniref:Fe2OG dioxygenase domain-containing protein n=1 Tax=Noctiluca scintillans TaxID=2966 RepID=A0A7S1ANP8_NOCSC
MSGVVPIIDVGPLGSSDAAARQEVARQIVGACEDIGFFVMVNHGIEQTVIDEVVESTLGFFNLPVSQKEKLISDDQATYPYGYARYGAENLAKGKELEKSEEEIACVENSERGNQGKETSAGDLREMFNLGPWSPESGLPPRRWPSEPAHFTSSWEVYYEDMVRLGDKLLDAFALGLGLQEDWFRTFTNRHISVLRANNYPSLEGVEPPPGAIRCSAHTDYGTITILRPGGPGLEVRKDVDGHAWHEVPFVEGAFVVNLGDLMRRWTNDRWVSTLHRVVNPPVSHAAEWGQRLSLAFFQNLNKDALVEPIPSCVSEEYPALYDPVIAGEFLMLKHLASMGEADPDAHLKKKKAL